MDAILSDVGDEPEFAFAGAYIAPALTRRQNNRITHKAHNDIGRLSGAQRTMLIASMTN